MSENHRNSKWSTTSRQQRALMTPAVDAGSAICWRCRRSIVPGTTWDVGHVEDASGQWVGSYAPEHSACNRRAGGRKGAAKTNTRRQQQQATDKRLPDW